MRARLEVGAVGDGPWQVAADVLNGGELHAVREQVRTVGDEALEAVEQRVEALVGGEPGRYGEHELGVDDRKAGEVVGGADADLLVRGEVRDDSGGVDLRAGSGRGRDGDPGQLGVHERQGTAGLSAGVVPEVVARLRREHRHDLRGIHDRAAAEGDDEVDAILTGEEGALLGDLFGRVGPDVIEDDGLDASGGKLGEGPVERAIGARGLSVGDDDHGLCAGHGLLMKVVELTGTKEDAGGGI